MYYMVKKEIANISEFERLIGDMEVINQNKDEYECHTDKGDRTVIDPMGSFVYTYNIHSEIWKDHSCDISSIRRKALDTMLTSEDEKCYGEIYNFSDLEDRIKFNFERFNKILPDSMVLKNHHPLTNTNFAKIAYFPNMEEPVVLTGARDHYVVLSTMYSHKELLRIYSEGIPSCACYGEGLGCFYVLCYGSLLIIENQNFNFYKVAMPKSLGRKISTNKFGNLIALENSDNVFFLVEYLGHGKIDIIYCEAYDTHIKSIHFFCDDTYVATKSGRLYKYSK